MLQVPEHGDRSSPACAYYPPARKPRARPLKPLALIWTLKRNPLECWVAPHFERPIVAGGLPIGHVLLVHEPGAIRRVLLDNAVNYRKDRLQRRVLSAGLSDGLLERWSALEDGAAIDVAPEMAKVTLDVVERTIFSDGFGSDAEDIRKAMT